MIRSALEDVTVQEWVQLKSEMNASQFKQMVRIARAGGIAVPGIVDPGGHPRMTFDDSSDVNLYQRVKDVEALNTFNQRIMAWSKKVEGELKASAISAFRHPDREINQHFPRLSDSIKANVRFDDTYKLETRSVGFSIARHGVFLHHGAGRGYGGLTGSKWTDKYGQLKSTSMQSRGRMGTGLRREEHWFNSVIERHMEELVGIVADYSLDITVNINSILIP